MSWTKYGHYGLFCNFVQFKNVLLIVYSRRVRYSSKQIYLLQKNLMKLLNTCHDLNPQLFWPCFEKNTNENLTA